MSHAIIRRGIFLTVLSVVVLIGFVPNNAHAARATRYDRRIIGLFGLGARFMAPLNLQTSSDTIDMSLSGEAQFGMILQHFEIYALYSTSFLFGSASTWGGGFNFRIVDSGPYDTHEGVMVPKFALKLSLEYVKFSPAISDPSKTLMRYGLGAAFRTGDKAFLEFAIKAFSLGKINLAPYLGFHFTFRSHKK